MYILLREFQDLSKFVRLTNYALLKFQGLFRTSIFKIKGKSNLSWIFRLLFLSLFNESFSKLVLISWTIKPPLSEQKWCYSRGNKIGKIHKKLLRTLNLRTLLKFEALDKLFALYGFMRNLLKGNLRVPFDPLRDRVLETRGIFQNYLFNSR